MGRKKRHVVEVELQAVPRTPKDSMEPKKHEPSEEDMDREAEFHLEDLLRAEKIKGDDKKMERVFKALEKKNSTLKSIADLKNVYEAKFGSGKKS